MKIVIDLDDIDDEADLIEAIGEFSPDFLRDSGITQANCFEDGGRRLAYFIASCIYISDTPRRIEKLDIEKIVSDWLDEPKDLRSAKTVAMDDRGRRCEVCNKRIVICLSSGPTSKYCSEECRLKACVKCVQCGGEFETTRPHAKYCSDSCRQRGFRSKRQVTC